MPAAGDMGQGSPCVWVPETEAGESPSIRMRLLVKPELMSGMIALGAMSISESKVLEGVRSSIYTDVF